MDTFVLTLDLIGTFVFALSGAMLGVRHRLDLFGVLVLSFATATAGGILRDVLIDIGHPSALTDWRYPVISVGAGVITFYWSRHIERLATPVRMFDALGLAVFAVAGTEKALAAGLNPGMAAVLGMVTGIGGGIMRDVLLSEVPIVFRSDLYAVAALAGASVVAVGSVLGWPSPITTLAGAGLCFGLRMAALRYGWHLPVAMQASRDEKGDPPP